MSRRSAHVPARALRLVRNLAIVGVLASSVAVAGCGGSSSSGSGSSASSSANKQDAARVKLNQCLRDQGVNVPDSAGGGGGTALTASDRQKLQTAIQGPCKKYQSQAFGNITDSQRQEFQDAFTKFSACMRQHGVNLPDPTANGNGGPPAGGQIDQSDPKVKAATSACQSKLPQNGPGGGGPGGGGGAQ